MLTTTAVVGVQYSLTVVILADALPVMTVLTTTAVVNVQCSSTVVISADVLTVVLGFSGSALKKTSAANAVVLMNLIDVQLGLQLAAISKRNPASCRALEKRNLLCQ